MEQSEHHNPHQVQLQILATSPIAIAAATATASEKVLSKLSVLTKFHAGYFRISLSLCGQALLWKTLSEPTTDASALRPVLRRLPSAAFVLLWSFAFLTLVALCLLYAARCLFRFDSVRAELRHHVGMNYLFAPWISWLLLLQSTPFLHPKTTSYLLLWCVFSIPILVLDLKIYGQWFTRGKRFLSMVANPTSQITVIGNLVGARAAAQMGWKESALFMFSLGVTHYLVLFVTLYQRLQGSDSLPAMLRPVLFLFFAAPSMASLAWDSICSTFDISCKMLFFLSLFLFASLRKKKDARFLEWDITTWITCSTDCLPDLGTYMLTFEGRGKPQRKHHHGTTSPYHME
ncbi:hypothetical protein GW17_00035222 [Ensete ventricosum]|nr:hypothetical protein GW17_00035222 [Ensete ventricosum]